MQDIRLLRIYTDEGAFLGDRRVLEVVAARAREAGLAGLTALEARIGFGQSAHLHRGHVLENDRALVIEIVDRAEALRAFVATLADVPGLGLITLEQVELLGGFNRPATD